MSESPLMPARADGDPPLIFSGSPLNRAEEYREDDAWLEARLSDPSSRFILYSYDKPLMKVEPELDIACLEASHVADVLAAGAIWVFLGLLQDAAFFAIDLSDDQSAAFGSIGKFIDARGIAMQLDTSGNDAGRSAMIAQGRSMLDWHARHSFCAACGTPTTVAKAGYTRKCSGCSAEHFPRTDPVVIMLATDGDRCLVGRQEGWPEGVYSALAGFMEPGETIEEAVRRELLEEAGITAGKVSYYACQPWPFPSSLMIGCFAEAVTTDIHMDGRELEDARWVDKNTMRSVLNGDEGAPYGVPTRLAIAYHLVHRWAFGDDA